MRFSALPVFLLAAATSAQTFTNEFTNSDPALPYTPSISNQAFDISSPPSQFTGVNRKDWDVTVNNGSVQVTGWASLPQSYIDQYPSTAGVGSATFNSTTTVAGLGSFKLSDLGAISYRITLGASHTAPTEPQFGLTNASDQSYFLYYGRATRTVTRSGPENTGDYIFTYTNFAADPDDRTYDGFMFFSSAFFDLPGFTVRRDQFVDITFQSLSVTLGTPVPEPSTYGLMLGGLALVGAVIRRRKISK